MEDKVIEIESEEIKAPENKFACLGIAECQQLLERLKGGIVIDELPYAVKALLEEYKYGEDDLKREVSERKAQLEQHRKNAVQLHISKKYAQALEGYEAYFGELGAQVTDSEAEQLKGECLQHVSLAKKKKIQTIAAVVIALILCGVIVDQVIFRQHVTAFNDALQARDFEEATTVASKISWRYPTEEGISNLVSFLDERENFNRLDDEEMTRVGLENYGGSEWQDVLNLVDQANANEDLPQGIQQLRQAVETTAELTNTCHKLSVMDRDFGEMYKSCNQKDADHYAHEKWELLEQLYEAKVTQTNLTLITDRYTLMVGITNQVATRMDAEKEMQPVKDVFEKLLKEERIQVQGMLNYTSSELNEAQRLAEIASKKEEVFQFADAQLKYTRGIEHVKESRKNRLEDVDNLANIEEARREFLDLYKRQENIEQAQALYSIEWKALSDQMQKAELEYAKKERWNGDAYVEYNTALVRLKNFIEIKDGGNEMYVAKARCDVLYNQVEAGVAKKWFADEWNAVRDQKKKADDSYKNVDHVKDDVRVYYDETSQMVEDLLVKMSDKAKENYEAFCRMINIIEGNMGKLERHYSDDWKTLQVLIAKADMEYREPSYWESEEYKSYISAQKLLMNIYKKGKEAGVIVDFNDFEVEKYDEEFKSVVEDTDESPSAITNGVPNP